MLHSVGEVQSRIGAEMQSGGCIVGHRCRRCVREVPEVDGAALCCDACPPLPSVPCDSTEARFIAWIHAAIGRILRPTRGTEVGASVVESVAVDVVDLALVAGRKAHDFAVHKDMPRTSRFTFLSASPRAAAGPVEGPSVAKDAWGILGIDYGERPLRQGHKHGAVAAIDRLTQRKAAVFGTEPMGMPLRSFYETGELAAATLADILVSHLRTSVPDAAPGVLPALPGTSIVDPNFTKTHVMTPSLGVP